MPHSPKPRMPKASKTKHLRTARKRFDGTVDNEPFISFGTEVCHDLVAAEKREWLVTNGIGGFASGTIAGSATRRYHGLLIAALNPPTGRTLLVGGIDELVSIDGQAFELATHRWASGAVAPRGYLTIQSFRLEGATPVWTYQIGGARIEKRVWMRYGENTTYVRYSLLDSASPLALDLKVLVNYRDFHGTTHAGDWRMLVESRENGICVTAFDGARPFYIKSGNAIGEARHIWYRDFFFARENERRLDDREDQLFTAQFHAQLEMGGPVTIIFSTEKDVRLDGAVALIEQTKRESEILTAAKALRKDPSGETVPWWFSQLILAADQFIVRRLLPGQATGKSIVAGYHWFSDWGRDTMTALPGLALATGRSDVAKQILLAFSRFVDDGMLPNNFPDSGAAPEYNTMDATLWYFEALRQYFDTTQDLVTLKKIFPILREIVTAHVKGTRYNIHVDPADGLLYGGGPGLQLTWMDAKIGDWVVTPRTGKPIEINALWINALETMIQFAKVLGSNADIYAPLLQKARSSFGKFWNAERNCCFDVLDAPGVGSDSTMRPNQIFAVSLGGIPLPFEQQKAVVDACASQLLTPMGLRSLAPCEPGYAGGYAGGQRERDSAYHQGTVWGWLLGPFALAHYRVYKDRAVALRFLEPLAKAIDFCGLGTLAEIFDGDAPHHPRGCIAQAWTVAEVLRAWKELHTQTE